MDHHVVLFVTGIVSARNAIIDGGRLPTHAADIGFAGLGPVAEGIVIALVVVRFVDHYITLLIAGVNGAINAIVSGRRLTFHAAGFEITTLQTVAEVAVITNNWQALLATS